MKTLDCADIFTAEIKQSSRSENDFIITILEFLNPVSKLKIKSSKN